MKSFLIDQIEESRTIAITGHTRPDGDCVGSCMGLYNYIKANYPAIEVDVYLEDFSESYHKVQNTDVIKTPGTEEKVYDLMICLDNSQKERMTKGAEIYFDGAKKRINIDHHISNSSFGDMNHVIGTASSACEVLYDLLESDKIPLSSAEALYMGIICDSGVFKYSSTSEHTMQIAGKLMTIGVDASRWIDEVFYERSFKQAKVLARALMDSVCIFNGKVIWTVVTKAIFDELEADHNDLEGVVEQLRLTKGVEVAILISETMDGGAKFSFRSKKYVDVNQVASIYGGGGHIRAAGCSISGDYKEPLKTFLEAIEGQLSANV